VAGDYVGVRWEDGEVFDSSYERGVPTACTREPTFWPSRPSDQPGITAESGNAVGTPRS
jgi:hypothetical protein